MHVIIVGAGIGGLSLALSLHAAGLRDIDIYESGGAIRELGVGINLLPHAVRELFELNLGEQLAATGVATAELAMFSRQGQLIWTEPRGLHAGYRWPQISIHRGRLIALLHQATVDRLGAARLHLDHHLQNFKPDGPTLLARFQRRQSGEADASVRGDVLVGADGIHSVVRSRLYPDEGPPKWNGVTMWRGTSLAKPFLSGRTMAMAGHLRQRVVVYPIARTEREDQMLINWVAEFGSEAAGPMPRQQWNHHADGKKVREIFADFRFPWLDFPELVANAIEVLHYPMCDRDPLPAWNRGPGWDGELVTLLGDAAHPMYPVGSNGASQAILDARVLARSLALAPSIQAALAEYESLRRPPTSQIVLANRDVGPEVCMEMVHHRAPHGFARLEDVITQEELREISMRYKQVAGFAIEELNARASLSC
jgi:2-polyprenyl-6-methoxyphenol hydroxylase-like FAD-dependent oxidoreductase